MPQAIEARVEEISKDLFQIHVPIPPDPVLAAGFSFNQYLLKGDEPLLFHTGPRGLFPVVKKAIERVLPLESIRYLAFSHCENDECGAMNELLAAAPKAVPVTGSIGMMLNADMFDRPGLGLKDGETLRVGDRKFRWLDAAHLPHGWDCGYLFEERSKTLLCGDLFTQAGADTKAIVRDDLLPASEGMRAAMEYYAMSPDTTRLLSKLAGTKPNILACMHGSAFEGDGARMLGRLSDALANGVRAPAEPEGLPLQ